MRACLAAGLLLLPLGAPCFGGQGRGGNSTYNPKPKGGAGGKANGVKTLSPLYGGGGGAAGVIRLNSRKSPVISGVISPGYTPGKIMTW